METFLYTGRYWQYISMYCYVPHIQHTLVGWGVCSFPLNTSGLSLTPGHYGNLSASHFAANDNLAFVHETRVSKRPVQHLPSHRVFIMFIRH